MSIPSSYYGRDTFGLSSEEGLGNLVKDAGIANVCETVDGMLYYIGAVSLPNAVTEDQRRDLAAEARVLRGMKNYLVELMDRTDDLPPEEEIQ